MIHYVPTAIYNSLHARTIRSGLDKCFMLDQGLSTEIMKWSNYDFGAAQDLVKYGALVVARMHVTYVIYVGDNVNYH